MPGTGYRPGASCELLADFRIGHGAVPRLVASLTGAAAMERRVPPLEPLVAKAGFAELRTGDVPPWLHYVRAVKP
ncbi:MAG TPA: hypothetical protein VKF59_14850 [Candidatus Dormibacteraeota bacterium]|nr:hypothetical protein [Candidatus Dormibacteraeota bacterium]